MQPHVHAWLLVLAIVLIRCAQSETNARISQDMPNVTVDGQERSNSTRKFVPFIIAGHLPVRLQFPYVAKLRWMHFYKRPKNSVDEIRCTAVIISQEFVVTAASCFQIIILDKRKKDDVTLDIPLTREYGRTFVQMNGEAGLGEVIRRVRSGVRLLVHKSYLHPSTMFDVNIALVQVVPRWSVKESDILKRPTPSLNLMPDDGSLYNCIGVGTGKVRPGQYSWEDQEKSWLSLSTGGVGYCKYLHKEFSQKNVHVDKFYMCGKAKTQGQDFCNGDLGSALVCNGLLSGILSQRIVKKPCQVAGQQFTMFTAIGSKTVYDWIKQYVPDFKNPEPIPPPPDPWDESDPWEDNVRVRGGGTPSDGGWSGLHGNATTLMY